MMVVTLTNTLELTSLESKAMTVMKRLFLRKIVVDKAARVLTIMASIGYMRRKGRLN